MQNYSTEQLASIASFASIIALLLGHFHVNIAQEDITQLLAALIGLGSIVYKFYKRYKRGDLTVVGFRRDISQF